MNAAETPRARRVPLDEMLPRLLARELPDHDVSTIADAGWRGVLNGELLRRAEDAGIEVFVTADRKMEHQQRLSGEASEWWSSTRVGPNWRTCTESRSL
jgi:hypothetical protein